MFIFVVYFQQNKKGRRPKEEKKQCHTKNIRGKKSPHVPLKQNTEEVQENPSCAT
jgi:hypothetical protein